MRRSYYKIHDLICDGSISVQVHPSHTKVGIPAIYTGFSDALKPVVSPTYLRELEGHKTCDIRKPQIEHCKPFSTILHQSINKFVTYYLLDNVVRKLQFTGCGPGNRYKSPSSQENPDILKTRFSFKECRLLSAWIGAVIDCSSCGWIYFEGLDRHAFTPG